MPTVLFVILVVLIWVMLGLGAALLFLGRHGYRGGTWYFLGAVLGPLFVPIAIERGRRSSRVLERTSAEGAVSAGQVVVLVGVDGSAESDRAVRDAAALFQPAHARIVLVAVADPGIGEFDDDAGQQKWHDLLAERARWLRPDGPAPVLEVLCGQPDLVLLEAVEAEKADALVIGRRGRGLSHRLLGSVAESLTRRATIPVLLAGPASRRVGTALGDDRAGESPRRT
jgi:nucleotide-binding universal stress UspA family protein